MKRFAACLSLLMLWPGPEAMAAYKEFRVKNRVPVIDESRTYYQTSRQSYNFRVEVISDSGETKSENYKDGRPFVEARKDERYAIRLYNPLPVRVAVNLTIDGLNSISGKPSGISDGDKWLLEPYGVITIRGWQVNGAEARRFFFTDKPKSYVQWRGDQLGKNLSVNCGVIGAAYFWSQSDLDRYNQDHPIYRYTRRYPASESGSVAAAPSAYGGAQSMDSIGARRQMLEESEKKEAKTKAGTGMGERETNPTTRVAFDYDRGMYNLAQAVVIYYDFASEPVPNPFPAVSFAPEMPYTN